MKIVRCTTCGEISDLSRSQTCRGCGEALPAEPTGQRPPQISPVQREASDDIDYSKGMLAAVVATAGLGAALIFFKDYGFMGAVLAIGLAAAFLFPFLKLMKKKGTATPDVPAAGAPPAPKAGPLPSPRLRARPPSAGSNEGFGSSVERGCGMFLKVIGIFIAVIVGLAAVGMLVLWIACMGSGGMGHF